MICPNCGFAQPDGRVCIECNVLIDPTSPVDRLDPGTTVWAESSAENLPEPDSPRPAGKSGTRTESRPKQHAKEVKAKTPREGMAEGIVKIIVTTGATVQGKTIASYKGPVTAASVVKLDVWDPFLAAVKEVAGLRNAPINEALKKAQNVAFSDLKIEAAKLEADAVIGTAMRVEALNPRVLLVYVSGTAVAFKGTVMSEDE